LGLLVGDIIDCGLAEFRPIIKELFDKDYVSTDINGDFEDVEELLTNPPLEKDKKEVQDIFELYEEITSTWASYTEDDDDDFDLAFDKDFGDEENFDRAFEEAFAEYEEIQQPAVSVKIGRNEPCPCGSGKKYKKCCIDKVPV
jgi:preprotein translocase subunit SecA